MIEEFSLKQEDVAARVGKSRSTIANALRLLKLPAEVQELLRDGSLSAGQVRPLLSLSTSDEQVRWARQATKERLTARDMERAVGRKKKGRRGRKRPDADTAAAEETLTKCLQSKVEIRRRGNGGTLNIAFHSEEELIRLYDLLVRAGERR